MSKDFDSLNYNKTFADLMTPEEAARYNQYWDDLEKIKLNAVDNSGNISRKSVTRVADVNGKTVTMDDGIFDPNFTDKQGRTNIERMKQGLAPIGNDGKSVNIHHIDQTNDGPVMEIMATEHQKNYRLLHTNTGKYSSRINRKEFDKWRREYWKWRSNNLN